MDVSPTPLPRSWSWPERPFEVALVQPEIPPNTGNIARLCAATGSPLHLVGPLGFRISDREMKRAGLDYWDQVSLEEHLDLPAFERWLEGRRFILFSTKGKTSYETIAYRPGDVLVFGSETRGLPDDFLARYPDQTATVPMRPGRVRSLNLANAASIVLYEALRQGQ